MNSKEKKILANLLKEISETKEITLRGELIGQYQAMISATQQRIYTDDYADSLKNKTELLTEEQ